MDKTKPYSFKFEDTNVVDAANEPFHLKNLSSVRLVEGDPLFHLVRGENHNKYLFKLQNIFV